MGSKIFIKTVFLFVFILNSIYSFSQYTWGHVDIGGTGFVDGILVSKKTQNVRFARTDVGGAYRWDTTATKWVQMLDWVSESMKGYLGIESIALDPQNDNNLYMLIGTSYFSGGATAILRSNDGGKTFKTTDVTTQFRAHGNSMGRQNGERLAVDPNLGSILFCGAENNIGLSNTPCLFKSLDSGATWSAVTAIGTIGESAGNNNGINFVIFDQSTGTKGSKATQTIIFGVSQTGTNLYISTNGGTSFSAISGAPTSLMPQRAVLSSNRILYITYADAEGPWNPTTGQIWSYNLATSVWTNITPVAGYPYSGISVDPNNPSRIIASTINKYLYQYGTGAYGDYIYLSTNGGSSWTNLMASAITMNANGCTWIPGATIHWAGTLEFNPFNTAQAYVGSGNGLFSCTNVNAAPTTWNFDGFGIEESVPLCIASIPSGPLFSTIGDYDGFKHSSVTTYAPQYNPTMGSTSGFAYAAGNTNYLVRVGSSMYYSTDQGSSWTKTSSINGASGNVAVTANAGAILHCPTGSSTTYRSTNNGGSWTACNGLSISNAVPVADMVNSNKAYAYNSSSGSMMVSTDGGANFSTAGSCGSGGSQIIRTVSGIEGDIWVALSNGIAHSTNSGTSFTTITNVTWCEAIGLGKTASTATYPTLYIWGTVGGVTGLFSSIDKGTTWTRINDDSHQFGGPGNGNFVIGDWNIYGRVYMSTVGLGIIYGDISTTTTPTVTIGVTSSATSVCSGTNVTLTANTTVSGGTISKVDFYDGSTLLGTATASPYTYTWANASVASHTVTAKATDNTSAVTTSSAITVTVNALPTISAGSAVGICTGSATTLTATGGLSYKWSNGITTAANTVTPTATATYTVTGTNASSCSSTGSVVVTVNTIPTINAGSAIAICNGTSTTLTATGGTSYKWNNSATTAANTVSPTTTTTYTVTGTNASSCSATSSVIVTVNASPTVGVGSGVAICNGAATTLTANGGASYIWSNGTTTAANTVSPTATTTYTVTGTSASLCSATGSVVVTVNALPTITPNVQINGGTWQNVINTTVTVGQSLALGPQPNVTTGWSWTGPNGYTASTRQINFTTVTMSQNGTFTATYTDANSCVASINQNITVLASQAIPLVQGWNLISTNVYPADSSITTLFNGLNVQEIKTADVFWENGQNTAFNSLTAITAGTGYLVYMNAVGPLQIIGKPMNTSNFPGSSLKTGWNIIGCPFQTSASLSIYFNTTNTSLVKDFNGFWISGGTTNSITNLDPGKGYFVKK